MSNHLLLNDKSQSSGSGIVCGLFLMRKHPCHWHEGCTCWQDESAGSGSWTLTGNHHLIPVIPTAYQEPKQHEKQVAWRKKKAPWTTNKAVAFQGRRTGGNTTDKEKEQGHMCRLGAVCSCFSWVKDAHTATGELCPTRWANVLPGNKSQYHIRASCESSVCRIWAHSNASASFLWYWDWELSWEAEGCCNRASTSCCSSICHWTLQRYNKPHLRLIMSLTFLWWHDSGPRPCGTKRPCQGRKTEVSEAQLGSHTFPFNKEDLLHRKWRKAHRRIQWCSVKATGQHSWDREGLSAAHNSAPHSTGYPEDFQICRKMPGSNERVRGNLHPWLRDAIWLSGTWTWDERVCSASFQWCITLQLCTFT